VLFVKDHSCGERNGKMFGKKLSTAVKDVKEIVDPFYLRKVCNLKVIFSPLH
jgi:hypothetical protein